MGSQNVLNSYPIVLISISTTGQGELPGNARRFWKKSLRKKLPQTYLAQSKVAVFGLGDTSYPQYNWAALKLHKRLRQLGATEIIPLGEGDEQHPEGYDAAFVPWMQALKERLLADFPLPLDTVPIPDDVLLEPPWLLELESATNKESVGSQEASLADPKAETATEQGPSVSSFEVELVRNERLTPVNHFQDVRHYAFSTREHITYLPGDILTINPKNQPDDVDQLLTLLHWDHVADKKVQFSSNPLYRNQQRPRQPKFRQDGQDCYSMTLRDALTSQLDFNAIPRRSFFSLIAHFTKDEFQRERLLEFSNPELVDELFDYTTRPRRSILEVLQEFDTLSIPWQWAAAILPQLRGRQFSIASGGLLKQMQAPESHKTGRADGTRFELLIAIVKYRTVIKKIRRGVCTRYLEDLEPGARLFTTLQRGALGITSADLQRPVIMVGPGTGLAPIRALIWQRWQWAQEHATSKGDVEVAEQGPMALFFGCRNENSDYFFRDEWKQLQGAGVPLTVYPAFSRDQARKIYVQDVIREQHELLYDLLHHKGGIVFVCGSSGRMPQAVRAALLDVLQKGANGTPEEAEAELKVIEKQGRYKQETW